MSGLPRRSDRWRIVAAALTVAAGELAAAWLAAGGEAPWRLWTAPVVLAGVVVVAGILLRPLAGESVLRTAFVLAVAILAASAMVALENPGELREFLPVVGAGAAGWLVVLGSSRARRRSGDGERRFC